MKRAWSKIMFGLIKKVFVGLLSSIVNASNHTECVLLSNQKCMIQPNLIRNFTTVLSQLIYIDVLVVVILLMIYLIKCAFPIKQKI